MKLLKLSTFLLFILLMPKDVVALSCSLSTSCSNVVVFKMSGTSNAHAELPTQANYGYYVCCSETGLSNSCSGNYAVILRLSSATNAHVEKSTFSNYPNQVCLSTYSGAIDCNYSSDCATLGSGYVCLASISSDTNAHVGDCNAYSTKVCCRTTACSYSLSINPSSGTYTDTTYTWQVAATDASSASCPSSIIYSITYSTSGSCDSSNTYVSPTSFSISRGSTLNNAFTVKVTRTGNSCNLSLSVKDPNGNVVATGTYTVSQAAPTTYTLNVNSAVDILGTALAGVQITVDGTSKNTDSSGKTTFSLSTGSHTITAQASFNGRPFSHFWDHDANADCNQNDPYDTANNPYSFTMNACTRDITAWYKVFTHFQNSAGTQGAIDYDGTTISGYLLREDNQPLHYAGGATVSLEYYDGSWHSIGTANAASANGYFSYSWSCVPGATQIRASFTDSSWYYTSSNGTKAVSCPSGQPDLIIEDIWSSGSTIYYRIKNQGNANAGASTSRLTIDGSNVATDSVGNLAVGASSDRSFSYAWTCSGANDTVTVCADVNNAVSESDETNNCRTETWNCADATPPTCSISSITESSAYAYSSGTSVWYNTLSTGSFTVNVAASDNVGVTSVSFPATVSAGGSDTSSPYSWTYNWDTADTYSGSATVTAYDAAGNTGTCSFNVIRDATAPTTTASVAGSYTITLSCNDNVGGSGCDKTYYCIDTTNTCNPTTQYTEGISTSCASCCYVRYYSVDRVSNQESTKSTQFGPTCGCVKANPSVSISPSSQSGSPGQTLTYTVNVTNNDNAACGSSIFSLTVTQCPSGFTCGLSKTSVTISPGSTDSSTTISVTSPSTATVGNYTFKVRATNNTYSGEAFANYSIPCTCTGWSNVGCGISPCASDQMKQSRSCSPSGCDIEEQCGANPLCTACNSNGMCDVAGPDVGETQINCPNDCYTRAKIIPWENLLPGAEVKVVVYFNDSRWYDSRFKSPGRDASLNLTIDGREWVECVVHNQSWKNNIGWPGDREVWPTVYQGKSVVITSTLGYAKLEANCSLPMWLGSGSHQFVAIPTIYSEPTVLAPATASFTVVAPASTPPVSRLDIFLQFLKSLLLIKIF